jgi:hypothetical protein
MKTLYEIINFYNEEFRIQHNLYLETHKRVHIVNTLKIILNQHDSYEKECSKDRMDNVKHFFSYIIYYPEIINLGKKFENMLFSKCEFFLNDISLDEECKTIIENLYEYRSK